jgi:hypothetical protein
MNTCTGTPPGLLNLLQHLRRLEAVLFSAKLPQEINAIDEVSVVADKKETK